MKIAFISRWLAEEFRRTDGKGGTELQRILAYQSLGHEVVALSQLDDARLLETRDLRGVKTALTPRWARVPWLALLDKLAKPLTQHRKLFTDAWHLRLFLERFGPFDVIEAQCEEPDGLVVATLSLFRKLPPWCAQLFALRYRFQDRKPVFTQRRSLGFVFARANLVKANSELVARRLTEFYGCPLGKIRVVYPNLAGGTADATPARTPGDLILCIGALNPTKGIEVFVEAVPALARKLAGAEFAVAGGPTSDDGYAESLQAEAASLGLDHRLKWLGQLPQEDLKRAVGSARVAVIPSLFDGWNRAAIECVCQGCPVVISDQCGASDWIRDNGCGVVVKAGDAAALAEGVLAVLSNPDYARNAAKAAAHALKQFDAATIAAANLAVFAELLAGRNRARSPKPFPA